MEGGRGDKANEGNLNTGGIAKCTDIHTYMHAHIHMYARMYKLLTHACTHTCMHAYTRICTHTFIQLHPHMKILKIKASDLYERKTTTYVILHQMRIVNEVSFWLLCCLKVI